MKAVVYDAPGSFAIKEIPTPDPVPVRCACAYGRPESAARTCTSTTASDFKLKRAEELGIDATYLMDRVDLAGDAARLKAASGSFEC